MSRKTSVKISGDLEKIIKSDNVALAKASIILLASRKREIISSDFLVAKKFIGKVNTCLKY
ncbi:hypothetical protein EfmAA242_26700 [Enterococcus faecium]|nr:hypothetical protein EfmAA242_26700 [Enterococcus faecium]